MADPQPLGSVVIPAWNEAAVIERTLSALFAGVDAGLLETVVACNGCTDDTAGVARRTGLPTAVIDLPTAGKIGAIRAGESVVSALPRVYLDADAVLPGPAAVAVLNELRNGAVAARPPVSYDTSGASAPVRCFYRQRLRLPSVQADLCGAGVYGLSAEARGRFERFPDVIADDLFAARIVDPSEVLIVATEPVVVAAPRTVRSLVRTLARVNRGNRELARLMPDGAARTTARTARALVRSVSGPRDAVDAVVYAACVVAGRLAAARARPSQAWERDDTRRATDEVAS